MKTWTVLEIINSSRSYLAEKGFENARLETELLLSHVLSLSRIELYQHYDRRLKQGELETYKALFKRRLSGEPVQYVTGTAAFMFSDFEVTPDVLIPRPETEALVEAALEVIGEMARGRTGELLVADVGTGSGVIAVTIALKVKEARLIAMDSSAPALAVARKNAEKAGVADKIEFVEGQLLEPLRPTAFAGHIAAIVSNPPYVATDDIEGLPAEVRDFEPREALDGGPDGLDCLRAIAQDGPALLAPGGELILEVGDGQAAAVGRMLSSGLDDVRILRDYAGRDRIVAARKTP
jgi:release factor glutamine methyltransferase